MADANAPKQSPITSIDEYFGGETTKEVFFRNTDFMDTIITNNVFTYCAPGDPPAIVPPPIVANFFRPTDPPDDANRWRLTKLADLVNVYTIQNIKSGQFAAVANNPVAGDNVVEATSFQWLVVPTTTKGPTTYKITPCGPKREVLYWTQPLGSLNHHFDLPTVGVVLQPDAADSHVYWDIIIC